MALMTTLPYSRPLTRADLDAVPDDGHRYELIDGSLIVTPAPSYRHQDVVGHLHLLLARNCPGHLKVLFAPFEVVLAEDTVLQPDLLVAGRGDFTARDLPGPPLLAVEVLSPSTARIDRIDRTLKRSRFEAAGCPSYWVVDPHEPSITVWELVGGTYAERADVAGSEACTLTSPFELRLTPSELHDPDEV